MLIQWTLGGAGVTPRKAAEDFAARAFDKPRKVIWHDVGKPEFELEDGAATYEVIFVGAHWVGDIARYEIWRLD